MTDIQAMFIKPEHVRQIEQSIPTDEEITKPTPIETIKAAKDTQIPAPPKLANYADLYIFENWIKDIESYFRLYGITDPLRKYGLFMIWGGPPLNTILRYNRRRMEIYKIHCKTEGITPVGPGILQIVGDTDQYNQSVTIIRDGFSIIYNVLQERQKFRAAVPRVGEGSLKYLERLASSSKNCEFEKYSAEDSIIDQFIEKCLDGDVKRRLLAEVKLDLRKLVLIVKQMKELEDARKPQTVAEVNGTHGEADRKQRVKPKDHTEMQVEVHYKTSEEKEELDRQAALEAAKFRGTYPSLDTVFTGLQKIRNKERPKNYKIDQFFYTNSDNEEIKIPDKKDECTYCNSKGHFESACLKKIRELSTKKSYSIAELKALKAE